MKKLSFITAALLCTMTVCKSQSIVSISPSSAAAGQTLNVTITGSGTHFLSGSATTLQFGFEQCSGTVVNTMNAGSDVSLTANITVPANVYNLAHDFEIFDFADGDVVKDHSFSVTGGVACPISLSPNSGTPGQTLSVTITGTGTHFLQGSSTSFKLGFDRDQRVCLDSIDYFSGTATTNTNMTCSFTIPSYLDTGYYDFFVYDAADNLERLQNLFHVTGVTGVNELEKEYNLEVAPNPFNGVTFLKYTLSHPESVSVELYDFFGRNIRSESFSKQLSGLHSVGIDAAALNLSSGIYYIRFSSAKGNVTKKILVNR